MKIERITDTNYLKQMIDCQLAMALETENYSLEPKLVEQGMIEVIKNPHRGKYYIALDDNGVVLGMLLTMYEWSDWRCADVLWIHSVYIYPPFRRQKVFSQMYDYLKKMVNEDSSYAGLRLYVDKTNLKAINVYQSLGMSDDHYALFEWLK